MIATTWSLESYSVVVQLSCLRGLVSYSLSTDFYGTCIIHGHLSMRMYERMKAPVVARAQPELILNRVPGTGCPDALTVRLRSCHQHDSSSRGIFL